MHLPRTQQELVVWYIEHVGFESFFASWHTEYVWTLNDWKEEERLGKLYVSWLEHAIDNFACTYDKSSDTSHTVLLNGIVIYTLSSLSHCKTHNRMLAKLLNKQAAEA